ncbi:hypothetical protein [Halobacterium jilantaiense]|uniref:Uncharacterized protein n=1 Tax=Halobacterium jilantaiense TaxID=355548 RepID=A0A1I0MMX7_9EURY|nr:hypothetical protein [Halobacterium jilantaiense]SEV89342.1 hypothetical protein SAMN04487945_0185 [Halobacterium jilantaiense]
MYEPSTRQSQLAALAALSGAMAVALHVLGGAAVEQVTGVSVGVAVVATLAVLYIHGQRRGSGDSKEDADESSERRKQEAEARKSGGDFL